MRSHLTLNDGMSRLEVERDPDGRLRIAVHDATRIGYSVSLNPTHAECVAEFIRGTA